MNLTLIRSFDRKLRTGVILVGLIVATAVTSLFWTPFKIDDTTGTRLEQPSWHHLFGTDKLGRDLFSRLMIGARIAIEVGFFSLLIGVTIGSAIGLTAGFARRRSDDIFSSFLDILIAFPTLLLAMLIVAARGASLITAIVAIGLGISAILARLIRLLTKAVLSKDFIVAARVGGASWRRIITFHVIPNIWPTVLVALALQFGLAGLAEASLSYLGLGAPPPNASWGSLLQEAQQTVYVAPWAAVVPGILLVILVIGVNLIADGLRARFDPTLKGAR